MSGSAAREEAHSEQNTRPQTLQWCLRKKKLNATPHSAHASASPSGVHLILLGRRSVLTSGVRAIVEAGGGVRAGGACWMSMGFERTYPLGGRVASVPPRPSSSIVGGGVVGVVVPEGKKCARIDPGAGRNSTD